MPLTALTMPAQLGPWRLESLAGEGAMSRVYRARRNTSARHTQRRPLAGGVVALKVLRDEWRDRPEAIGLLRHEFDVSQQVSHPRLVRMFDAQLHTSPYFLVMEWLDGDTLQHRLADGYRPSLPQALSLVRQAAEALDALYAKGWMHGDIKPGNLFLLPTQEAKLIDLGFARRLGEAPVKRTLTGTVDYMAPERMSTHLPPDIRSDLYSLGVMLFELLTGRLPYVGQNMVEVAQQHRTAPVPEVSASFHAMPESLRFLVRQLLAKDPAARPQTPAEVIRRLVMLEIDTFADRVLV